MPLVDRYLLHGHHAIQVCTAEGLLQCVLVDPDAWLRFDGKQPLSAAAEQGRTADAGLVLRGALHGERVERALRVGDHGGAAAEEPEPPFAIEIAGVARAVPHLSVHLELR